MTRGKYCRAILVEILASNPHSVLSIVRIPFRPSIESTPLQFSVHFNQVVTESIGATDKLGGERDEWYHRRLPLFLGYIWEYESEVS